MENSSMVILDLHHVHGPCSPLNYTPLPLSKTLHLDEARAHSHSLRFLHNKHEISNASIQKSLKSGYFIRILTYIISLDFGSPPKPYLMEVDTGSVLTWLQCRPCIDCHRQSRPIFDPKASSTYSRVSCQSDYCMQSQQAAAVSTGCSDSGACKYEINYGDGSFSVGLFSKDTITMGRSFPGFIYGCGEDNEGYFGWAAGLIGMGRHPLSLMSQLAPTYGYTFSYCLPTPDSTGSLTLGPSSAQNYMYTPMYHMSVYPALYFVQLIGIKVDGHPLPVSDPVYRSSRMLIDSGTTITRLPKTLYTALKTAVLRHMPYKKRAPPGVTLDTCFKVSTSSLHVPEVVLDFRGGAQMRLGGQNVVLEVDNRVTCLAFAGTDDIPILGNRQQQGFDVTYDVVGRRIGFAPGRCG
ncbi:aspartyl protease family protein At5g10770 [Amborella trichopoda]|uniref:Peptidase A1 domain-containing protein n=1 Tax=Amborella trichopoda TaxID=13333 RepID=U5DC90_AMBTC|nr:aspartyl protease family protein At5g10770 [Amborella trichopoda]ERN19022.1 hypothetical protein AMTR_s00061p00053670 [Amborella trichopoda]|eukprot:XP_006857555.1 aspartyl protease family protein At5g10770 [Amborella trichopoda]